LTSSNPLYIVLVKYNKHYMDKRITNDQLIALVDMSGEGQAGFARRLGCCKQQVNGWYKKKSRISPIWSREIRRMFKMKK